jgi:hypothetical protein
LCEDLEVRLGLSRQVGNALPVGELLALLELPAGSSSLTFDGTRYTLRAHGLCDVELDHELRTARVHLAPDADAEFAPLFVGNVLAALLALRGHCVLHASAVEVAHEAFAFVAGSGMGKTTVAALCCIAGAKLLSDDVLRVETARRRAWCYRGSLELRLREQAAELAERIGRRSHRSTLDHRTAVRPYASKLSRLPLAAIVTPTCAHGAEELEIARLRGIQAVRELVAHPRTLGWLNPEHARHDFHVLTQIARRVPVYRAILPWGPPFRLDLGQKLLSSLV